MITQLKWDFAIISKEYALSKNYKYIDIDGVKVLFDDGWALVRASNTGPNITARFEANSKELLDKLQKEYTDLINELNVWSHILLKWS